jgi:hypothetical protein
MILSEITINNISDVQKLNLVEICHRLPLQMSFLRLELEATAIKA